MTSKLKSVLKQRQIGNVACRTRRFNFGNDGGEYPALEGVGYSCLETVDVAYGDRPRNSRGTRHSFQIRTGTGRGWKAADRQQTLVIENNMGQVARVVASHGRQRAQIHEQRTIAVQDNHVSIGQAESKTEAGRRRQPHGVLQVKEIGPMPQ